MEETSKLVENKQTNFKERDIEERKQKISKLLEKNPNKVPLIFDRDKESTLPQEKSLKFMSTRHLKLAHFAKQLRSTLNLDPDSAIYFSTGNLKIIKHDILIGDLYDQFKDQDGGLYVQYREVETFGSK